jgi:hypothetical protein
MHNFSTSPGIVQVARKIKIYRGKLMFTRAEKCECTVLVQSELRKTRVIFLRIPVWPGKFIDADGIGADQQAIFLD